MTHAEIEALYYFLQNSILLGEKDKAKTYLWILRHEYELGSDFSLEQEQLDNLTKYGQIVDNDLLVKRLNFEQVNVEYNIKKDEETIKEDLLRDKVLEYDIKGLISADDTFRFTDKEVQTRFGRVDIIGKDKNSIYVFELKRQHAKHDIISQIEKYLIHYKLKLINKMYKYVIGITIANSYDKYTIKELKKNSIVCLKYSLNEDKIILKEIK